jgi:hypothetical protein
MAARADQTDILLIFQSVREAEHEQRDEIRTLGTVPLGNIVYATPPITLLVRQASLDQAAISGRSSSTGLSDELILAGRQAFHLVGFYQSTCELRVSRVQL